MEKMFEKLNQDFLNGNISKSQYRKVIRELRQKKDSNILKKSITKKEKQFIDYSIIDSPKNDTGLFDLLYNILLDNNMINDSLNKDIILNVEYFIRNDYLIGLFNLLSDKTYFYNKIGLKYVIANYLYNLDSLNNLKVFKVDNNILSNSFKFLVYKNNKIKNFTKLYFNNEYNLIIMNTLKHDNIVSIVLFDKTKYTEGEIYNIIQNTEISKVDNIDYIDIKKSQYTLKEIDIFPTIQYLIYTLEKIKYQYKSIKYNDININKNNLKFWLNYIDKNYTLIYKYDLLDMYNYIFDNYNKDEENNSLNIKDNKNLYYKEIEDYYKYDIKLKDYFLNP